MQFTLCKRMLCRSNNEVTQMHFEQWNRSILKFKLKQFGAWKTHHETSSDILSLTDLKSLLPEMSIKLNKL